MSSIPSEVYPILWSDDVAAVLDWATHTLGLTESWRAPNESGVIEHAELLWPGGRVSININTQASTNTGPSGIALRIDDHEQVDAIHTRAIEAGASIAVPLAQSPVAYGFTVLDPDQNQWWVNAETGMLDELRDS